MVFARTKSKLTWPPKQSFLVFCFFAGFLNFSWTLLYFQRFLIDFSIFSAVFIITIEFPLKFRPWWFIFVPNRQISTPKWFDFRYAFNQNFLQKAKKLIFCCRCLGGRVKIKIQNCTAVTHFASMSADPKRNKYRTGNYKISRYVEFYTCVSLQRCLPSFSFDV